ncbi:helix-turn-helix domain-containing protein [Spirochaeta isovalerica]|uniref:Transcriptional regulator with XRE-family HTH domain n=1 Tax=Spirochaeta isovalerica TaxID=150 RepID=A0A841R3Y2_9SPIO|nr:XRE family transcriptional regulator [Spirochaeta isovalerica]MBB6478575.1 transcriptional regulator with XRE-family HTH domain [Spirochaeta isovalerica]
MPKNLNYRFGEKIRLVRERRGMTLKEVGAEANVSESLVSQIERNKVSPSVDTLMAITDALDIDPEYLFRDYKKKRKVQITHEAQRNSLTLNNVIYYQLASILDSETGTGNCEVETMLIEIQPGGQKGDIEYGHPGNEIGIILSGKGELLYGTETHILNKGDSLSFSSDIPHILRNLGEEKLEALWIITPPRVFKD